MFTLLIILAIIASVLLILAVLIQNPKGGGLATGFQGASQLGGVQKTTDFQVKATWVLTGALFVLCIVAGIFFGNMNEDVGIDESILPTTALPMEAPAAE